MTNIREYCEGNQDFQQLLEKFTDGYISIYNKRRVALRNDIKIFMKRNFNTWYYSIDSPVCPVSPARFINSDIYNKFGGDYVVFPVCSPEYKRDKLMTLNYSFRVFTLDDHPFIRDLKLFLDVARDQALEVQQDETVDYISDYALKCFPIIDEYADLTFHERPYVITLCNVCEMLSLITFCGGSEGIMHNEESIDAFFALPGRDKLERVIAVLVEHFARRLEFLTLPGKRPEAGDVMAVLHDGQGLDSFLEGLFDDRFSGFLEYTSSMLEDDYEDDEDLDDFVESFDEEKMVAFQEIQLVLNVCCSDFFTVFGQYLQLIQPEHDDAFVFSQSDDNFLALIKMEEDFEDEPNFRNNIGSLLYYLTPEGYSLTALGTGWFKKDMSLIDDQLYPLIPPEEYQETLDEMLEEYPDDDMDWSLI